MDITAAARSYSMASAYAAQRLVKVTAPITSGGSQTAAGDTLSISPRGAALCGLASKLGPESFFGFTPKTPGQVSIDEMEYYGRKFLDKYNTKLNALFGEHGIDTGTPVELSNAFDDSIVVTNSHPDKTAIEKLFKENTGLINEFNKINGMLTLHQTTETMLSERSSGSHRGTATLLEFLPKEAGPYMFSLHITDKVEAEYPGSSSACEVLDVEFSAMERVISLSRTVSYPHKRVRI